MSSTRENKWSVETVTGRNNMLDCPECSANLVASAPNRSHLTPLNKMPSRSRQNILNLNPKGSHRKNYCNKKAATLLSSRGCRSALAPVLRALLSGSTSGTGVHYSRLCLNGVTDVSPRLVALLAAASDAFTRFHPAAVILHLRRSLRAGSDRRPNARHAAPRTRMASVRLNGFASTS